MYYDEISIKLQVHNLIKKNISNSLAGKDKRSQNECLEEIGIVDRIKMVERMCTLEHKCKEIKKSNELIMERIERLENKCTGIRKSNDLIYAEIIKIGQDMKALKSKARSPIDADEHNMNFAELPLVEVEKFNQFDNKLIVEEGMQERFTKYLKSFGGVNYKNAIHIIMRRIMAPELGMKYSLRGRTDKIQIGSTTIYKCISS